MEYKPIISAESLTYLVKIKENALTEDTTDYKNWAAF